MAVQTTVTSQCFPTLMENVMNRHGFNVKVPQIRRGAFTHITRPFLFQLLMVLVVILMLGWEKWVVGKCTGMNIKPKKPNVWSKTGTLIYTGQPRIREFASTLTIVAT